VIIFVIQIDDLFAFGGNGKGQPPVSRDREAPCSLAIARELVNLPRAHVTEFADILHLK